MVGTLRLWHIAAGSAGPALLLGPIAVEPKWQSEGWGAALMRHIQSGYVYHYAFTMIVGVFALLTWWVGH